MVNVRNVLSDPIRLSGSSASQKTIFAVLLLGFPPMGNKAENAGSRLVSRKVVAAGLDAIHPVLASPEVELAKL